jgi:putative membrane protein
MITYDPKNWIQLIFALNKSDTFRMLWKELIYIALLSMIIAFLEITFFPKAQALNSLISVYSLLGFVISLLLVFRTNTAYDRWWEGRKIWGQFINDSRNLSVKLASFNLNAEERNFFARMIPNFALASKEHLRRGTDLTLLDLLDVEKMKFATKSHIPLYVMNVVTQKIELIKNEARISNEDYLTLSKNLDSLIDGIGACERIKSTPIPFSYSMFIKKFIFIYVISLPLAFVNIFGYWSSFISTFVFYALVSMEILAEEIEDPFGVDDNDLPTDSIALKIKQNCEEVFEKK